MPHVAHAAVGLQQKCDTFLSSFLEDALESQKLQMKLEDKEKASDHILQLPPFPKGKTSPNNLNYAIAAFQHPKAGVPR